MLKLELDLEVKNLWSCWADVKANLSIEVIYKKHY